MIVRNSILENLDPSEILEPSSLQYYEEGRDLIWKELVLLNSYLFILEKVFDFESDWLLGPRKDTFIALVKISMVENSLLLISKLTTATSDELLSMTLLRKWIGNHIRDEYKKPFDQSLREANFSKIIEKTRGKVKDIRDKRIAHLIVDQNLRPQISGHFNMALQELKAIREQLNRLFDLLCFGIEHPVLPIEYDPRVQHPVGSDTRSDIEYILDLIAQDSYLIKLPELPHWDTRKEHLDPEALKIITEYRIKFGMTEV